MQTSRRDFVKFMGRLGAISSGLGLSLPELLAQPVSIAYDNSASLPFSPLRPTTVDRLVLAEGFTHTIIVKEGDALAPNLLFGDHNDFLAFIPLAGNPDDGILWANHESVTPLFISQYHKGSAKTKEQVSREMDAVGGSLVRIRRNANGKWQVVANDAHNRRLSAHTPIPFANGVQVAGSNMAIGTLANCAGGVTPWKTVLTCEENYSNYFGEVDYVNGAWQKTDQVPSFGWSTYFPYPPEQYGWVVEINPLTGQAQKLTGLGRFVHEGATPVKARDGRCVVYMGDDGYDECLYKFISAKPDSLTEGTLYVANLSEGKWIPLDFDRQPVLRSHFRSQLDVLIGGRQAGKLLGGTPLDRPEDIEIDPITQAVVISISAGSKTDIYGSLLRIMEDNNDHASLTFRHDSFLAGGEGTGFACPDNLAFDKKGNLWMCSDVSGSLLNKAPYTAFGNNGLYYVPTTGENAGKVFQVASCPADAEFTGLQFDADCRTLFISVQHPGQQSTDSQQPTSRWPGSGSDMPRSAVIAIEGPALAKLVN